MVPNDFAWQVIAALQGEADSPTIDRSLARDEAFDVVLAETIADPNPDPEKTNKRFKSLCRNRRTKISHRRRIEDSFSRPSYRRGGSDFGHVTLTLPSRTALDDLIIDECMLMIRAELPDDEFAILMEIADGSSYNELAGHLGITVASLKSRVLRARNKVRNGPKAALLRRSLQQ